MTLGFVIAPDFAPERISGWYMLSTALQRRSGIGLHLYMPADAAEQAQLLEAGRGDLVYANPFDASTLIRQEGYVPFARPVERPDEMVIAVVADAALQAVEDLRPGVRIALTRNRDVRLIGLRLLEPADLDAGNVQWVDASGYPAVARLLLQGQADAGFFLASAWHELSSLTRSRLKPLVESALCDITHVLLAHPRLGDKLPQVAQALLGVGKGEDAADREVLEALGIPKGFEPMSAEDAEFMIDLMDTLLD